MKENIDNDEKMMPFRVHDNRWSYSGKLSNYELWRVWPPTSDLVIPTLYTAYSVTLQTIQSNRGTKISPFCENKIQ